MTRSNRLTSYHPLIRSVTCLALALLTGCATGLLAEPQGPTVAVPASPSIVRVRILYTKVATRVGCAGSFRYGPRSGGSVLSNTSVKVRASGSAIVVGSRRYKGDVLFVPSDDQNSISINGRRFRGTLLFHPVGNSRYDVIEYLGLSEYLYGVLPKEVDATWPLESLKAQAVVSRSYAVASKMARASERYDLSATVLDQVYGGQDVEKPDSNRAVDETRGDLLVDAEKKPVRAFFHAACGGRTDLPEYVWKTDPSQGVYGIVSDSDYCEGYPRQHWKLTMSLSALRDRMRRAGLRIKSIRDVTVMQKSPSGRSQIVLLTTSKGEIQVAGNRFRLALGPETLRSTFLTNVQVKKNHVYFEGLGWGHGVGLCQWGARGRALAGQTYQTILLAYYPKAELIHP